MLSSGHVEILEEHAVSVQCSLASGEPITLRRKVDLKVLFVTVEGSLVTARLSALVAADCSHAILSTGQMALRGWEVSINAEGVNVSLRTNDGHHVVLGSCIYGNVGWCYSVPCGLAASLRDGSRLGRELNRGGDATGVHGGAGWLREPLDGAPESGSLEQSLEHRDLEVTSLAEGEQRLGQSGGPRQGDSAAGGHRRDAVDRGGGDSRGLR